MVKRSLQVSLPGIQQAKRSFALKGWTQDNLAGEVNLKTRQPIWRFFTGQPVDRQIFMEICLVLDLDWRKIAIDPPADFPESTRQRETATLDINGLVQQVRSLRQSKIQDQCGILQLLDISYPVSLEDIYIDVNILESIASQQRLEVATLQTLDPKAVDRIGLGEVAQPQVSGMQAVETHSRLRVLGKPGAGKTTFLQHLALQCSKGTFETTRVPIFITLRDFVKESISGEFSLLNYLRQEFLINGIADPTVIETLLKGGRVMLLLDGIDEVLHQESVEVLRELRRFSDKYHKNRFVTTCRTAAQKLMLRGFTDVEIAPFTQAQIVAFAQKWFTRFTKTTPRSELAQSTQFITKLDLPENWQFRQLVGTPLFLHLACWVFHGQGRFPTKRTEFYKEGLDLLLGKWDEARGVERDEVYQDFSLPQKLKLLSQLAAVTFEQGQYFFEQRVVEQHIEDYIRCLPNASTDDDELQLESESVLKAIESQHGLLTERARGIFSFSYLAFQEYFTARNIVASHNLQALEQALGGLVSHLTDPHWHEIFLMTAAMLRSADSLMQLMKQQIDALVAKDPYLQDFLLWASQKAKLPAQTKEATVRAFYLALAKTPHHAADFAIACTLDQGMFLDVALDDLLLKCAIDQSPDFAHAHLCGDALSNILGIVMEAGFHKSLQQLQDQLPHREQNQKEWQLRHDTWVEQLKMAIAHYRQLHHDWQFTPEQGQVLQRYYDANQLLLDCLHSNCEVTATIRQEIEATLLLPQKEIEAREWQ